MNGGEPHPVSTWVQNVVRGMYVDRAPTRPSLQELMWRLREGAWFKNLMAAETPPSSVAMSTSEHVVQDAVVALSALLRAIDEHGPYRIPFDIEKLADLRRVLSGDVDPVTICNWMRTFCSIVVCFLNGIPELSLFILIIKKNV